MFTFLISAATLSWMVAFAQPASAADLLITNARLFDGTGSGMIENASIAVANGRIEAISATPLVAAGATVIDAGGKTVMPGLINGHFHLFFDFYNEPPYVPRSDAEAQAFAREKLPEILAGHLEQGFTSMVSAIDFWPYIVDVREQVATGRLKGPRLFIAGGVLMNPGGHYACRAHTGIEKQWCDEHIAVPIDQPELARAAVRKFVEGGVDMIVYDGLTNTTGLKTEVVAAMTDEAHRHGLRVLVHNADARDAGALVEAGVDGFLHPPGGTRDTDGTLLAQVGAKQIPLAITLGRSERNIRLGRATERQIRDYEAVRHNVLTLLAAGAVPIFASDYPGIPPEEVAQMVVHVLSGVGLSNEAILLAATRDAAHRMLGRQDLGTLEPGKVADLIIVDGDPLDDLAALSRVRLVVKGGAVVVDRRSQ